MNSTTDNRYFINKIEFNCPFCKGNSVGYEVLTETPYDWSNDKEAYAYTVKCKKCGKMSLHLSHYQMDISYNQFTSVYDEQMRRSYVVHHTPIADIGAADVQQMLDQGKLNLDELFFFHWPER